jgi:hypothetical protein
MIAIDLDAYPGGEASRTTLRGFASTSGRAGTERESGRRRDASSGTGKVREDHRWIARAGGEARGRVRLTASAIAASSITLERVTVEWYGVEWIGEGAFETTTTTTRGGAVETDGKRKGERFVARSPPGELARAVTIEPGETVSFKFGVDLPPGLAPSFRGERSRYWYRVAVKATTGSGEVLEVIAPLTVRTSGDGWDVEYQGYESAEDLEEESRPDAKVAAPWIHVEDTIPPESPRFGSAGVSSPRVSTPFKNWGDVEPQSPNADATSSGNYGLSITPSNSIGRGRKSKVYIVSMGDDRLIKVTLRKPAPKCAIGEDVAGILDFTCAKPDGHRAEALTITLESEEIIHSMAKNTTNGKPPVFQKAWIETRQRVEHLDSSHFVMPLPFNCPGNFRTSNVEVKWFLRFDITTVKTLPASEFASFFRGDKNRREHNKLEWILPLDVGSDWLTSVNAKLERNTPKIHRDSSLVAL